MVCSITLSWFIGLVFLLILLLSLQDIDAILDAKLHIPVAQIFWVSVIYDIQPARNTSRRIDA